MTAKNDVGPGAKIIAAALLCWCVFAAIFFTAIGGRWIYRQLGGFLGVLADVAAMLVVGSVIGAFITGAIRGKPEETDNGGSVN